jgi:hypothetical protein
MTVRATRLRRRDVLTGAVDGRPDDAAVLEGIGVFLAAP